MSQLLLIPVPGGMQADGTAALRLMIVPRFDTGSLADNGFATWPPPELRKPLQMTFTPTDGAPVTVDITPRLSDQEGLWSLVFGAATVTPAGQRRADALDTTVTVSPTGQYIREVHTSFQAAAQAYSVAAATDPDGAPAAYSRAVGRQLGSSPWTPPPISLAPDTTPTRPAAVPKDSPTPVPASDVNRIYGLLREHPRVLAALGLILDLDVAPGTIPDARGGVVRVDWSSAAAAMPAQLDIVPHSTAYGTSFLPAAHPVDAQHPVSDLDDGLVCLDIDSRWQLADLDSESAGLRMVAAATSGPDLAVPSTDPTPSLANTLPALRTAGVMLLRTGRQQDFDFRRARSLAVTAADEPTLYAEDLVLGYRIDVRRAGDNQWHPLCVRQATYTINDVQVGEADALEEGHVKAHAAQRDDAHGMRADEVVTRWDGWSLAVPRPYPPAAPIDGMPDGSALLYRLGTEFTVPAGTLPPLRFGVEYQLRARVADLAGGGRRADDPDDTHASATHRFVRYEPVTSPRLLLPTGVGPDDLDAGVHAAQLVVTSEAGATPDPGIPASIMRQLTRPTVSLATAEWHGAVGGDTQTTWAIAQLAAAGILPDPAADGVAAAIVAEPGSTDVRPVATRWPAWPDTAGSTVELRAGTDSGSDQVLAWGESGLVVTLAPGQDVAVQISSTVAASDLPAFAVTYWSDDPTVHAAQNAALAAVTAGAHPMVTPSTTLRCVHAVQRPLVDPSGALTAARAPHDVPVALTPSPPMLGIDPRSTGQVDITASWTEVTDDLTSAPADVPVRTQLTDVPVQSLVVNPGDTTFDGLIGGPIEHHLPDTRHRAVTYTVTAISRFRDLLPAGPDDDFTAAPLTCSILVPSTERPAPPKIAAVVPAFVWTQTLGPTITRTRLGNRIRVEVERPWFDSGDGEQLALIMTPTPQGADEGAIGVTQVGRDPVFATSSPPRWPLSLAATGSGGPSVVVPSTDDVPVAVVRSDVVYDPDSGRWFADFALPGVADGSYAPLVRPALARYQANSVAGAELSATVLADFVRLLPDRTLTVTLTGNQVTVLLAGLDHEGPIPNRVDVALENAFNDPEDVGPAPLQDPGAPHFPFIPPVTSGRLNQTLTLTLPDDSARRLRVREVEWGESLEPVTPIETPAMGTPAELTDHVVFVDIVPLAWAQQPS